MLNKPQYIIAFDLSFTNTGVALINTETKEVALDEINTSSKDPFETRIKALRDGLQEIYDVWSHFNPYVSVELITGYQSSKAAKCGAAAVSIWFCSPWGDLPQAQYGSKAIKDFVGERQIKGYERKRLNINKAVELFPDAPFPRNSQGLIPYKNNHVADALILGYLAYVDF